MVDAAEGAPTWIGLVLSPWLAGPWLAGAWIARRESSSAWGAAAGVVLLSATVAAYLVLAGLAAGALVPGLPLLAISAGLGFGMAGAELHHGERGRQIAAVALGGVFMLEGVLLQQDAADQPIARGLLMLEVLVGVGLATWLGGLRAGLIVLVAGAIVLGITLVVQTG